MRKEHGASFANAWNLVKRHLGFFSPMSVERVRLASAGKSDLDKFLAILV